MKTASFFTYDGPGRVCIARWHPRGTPKGFRCFRDLAPGEWFNKVSTPVYLRRYAAQLDRLKPELVLAQLHALAAPHDPVLLCWEQPGVDDFCHRALVAQWFERELKIKVPELGYEGALDHPLLP